MRVLLVEDETDLRDLISAGLASAGYAVDAVADWPQADMLLTLTEYDCVVLDRHVPSGYSGPSTPAVEPAGPLRCCA
jgi:DNA-binding response OmpR family regulator